MVEFKTRSHNNIKNLIYVFIDFWAFSHHLSLKKKEETL